jgi:hypothetical protein
MKNVRAVALLLGLALLPACGSSILAPEVLPEPDALFDEAPECDPEDPEASCFGGYIGSGS